MMEPTNPEHYWIYVGPLEVDGKEGKGKVKKWASDNGIEERILSFDPFNKEDINNDSTI